MGDDFFFEVRQDDFEDSLLFDRLPDEMQKMYNEGERKFRYNYSYDLHGALREIFKKTLDEMGPVEENYEPDYDNRAREYEDACAWAEQPTPYDP